MALDSHLNSTVEHPETGEDFTDAIKQSSVHLDDPYPCKARDSLVNLGPPVSARIALFEPSSDEVDVEIGSLDEEEEPTSEVEPFGEEDESSNKVESLFPDLDMSLSDLVLPSNILRTSVHSRSDSGSPLPAETPRLRTLSEYRKEQQTRFSSARESNRSKGFSALFDAALENDLLEEELIQRRKEKFEFLQSEVTKLSQMINQCYRALALCIQRQNVSERIAAEQILLVNTMKKNALCKELLRLQLNDEIRSDEDQAGQVTIKRIQIKVRKDFVEKLKLNQESEEYYFICLFECGEVILETEILPSSEIHEAWLSFTKEIRFMDLRRDFAIQMDIYVLEILKSKRRYRKLVNSMSRMDLSLSCSQLRTSESSLHGTGFQLVGSAGLTYDNLDDNLISIDLTQDNQSIEGQATVRFSMSCRYLLRYSSYLSFNQMSGDYPVWNRRWCVINDSSIDYWRYQEDEEDKEPMGSIDLRKCVNKMIEKATSAVCMRPNSFAFVIIDEQKVPVTHLMAADLPRERDDWLTRLNGILELTRTWNNEAVGSFRHLELDSNSIRRSSLFTSI